MHLGETALAGKRTQRGGVAVKRHLRRSVGEEGLDVGEAIGGAAVESCLQMFGPDFDADLHVVISVNPVKAIDEGERVIGERRGASIEGTRQLQLAGGRGNADGPLLSTGTLPGCHAPVRGGILRWGGLQPANPSEARTLLPPRLCVKITLVARAHP